MNMIVVIWSVLAFLVIYHHLIYPWVLTVLGKNQPPRDEEKSSFQPLPEAELPLVTLVVPCYNEANVIAQKIHNVNFLDYPKARLNLLIIDDGSTDNTADIVEELSQQSEFSALAIQLHRQPKNAGKVAALNWAAQHINLGYVVLTDASALISIDALQRLAVQLADPDIAVVCASYEFLTQGSAGEIRYWQYQRQLKQLESQLGSTVGAHGAMYALRAEDFNGLPADTINDDFVLPMSHLASGRRCIYDNQMVAVELEQASLQQDFSRRQRIAAGNLQQALRLVHLLHPKQGWLAWNFFSGKWLRAFMPMLLVALWLLSAFNPSNLLLISMSFWLQTTLYALALWVQLKPNAAWPALIKWWHYLVLGYFYSGIGGVHYLLNPAHFSAWQRATPSEETGHYLSQSALLGKRVFDVLIAGSALLCTLPLWPVIAVAIKLESKGPVLFRQMRIGRALPDKTELFEMLKFRTMAADAEAKSGAVWASSNDPRITRIGKFMRKTRIDELPQLLNVLRGEMSLVGPRPERPGIGRDLDRAIPFYAERTFFVTPGITGLAQVNQGYDTCLDDVKSKLLYDHAYALSLSRPASWIRMDVEVALKTLWVMVAGRGQ